MAAGLREDIDLDISAALRDVDKLEAALTQTAKQFKVELAKAADVLRGPGGTIKARVDVDDKGSAKRVAADVNKIEAEAKGAEQASKKLGSSFDGVRTAAAGALAALGTRFVVDQIGQMISAASDLAESQSKIDAVFQESQGTVLAWSETSAQSVGLAKQAALEAAGTFGNLFTALGLSQDAAAKLSPDVVQLGADFASFNNLEVPETLEKLRSGLVGEIEPLRSLGISFNAAQVEAKAMALGLADANGEVSEGAKVQARWALITEQSSAAAGDFARTSDGLANQQRILKAEIGNAQAEIGARLLPVMLKAVEVGRSFLNFFLELPGPVQNAVLGFVALGIAIGPLLLAVGNVSKVVGGASTALTAMSKALSVSTLTLGVWAGALAGIGVAYVLYTRLIGAMEAAQAKYDEAMTTSVNNLALASVAGGDWESSVEGQSKALKDNAIALFLADKTAQQLDEDLDALAAAGVAMGEKVAKATKVLDEMSEATGVSRERIVQLANDMRINLATATDEQREKLGAAVATIAGGVTPTERLAEAQEILGNEFATAKESIDAFSEALDAALGVYLSSEQATIRVRQRVDELGKAFKEGRKEGETLQQFQDRLTLSTIDVTDAVTKEVEALVRDGSVSADAASQKEAIISRLLHLADVMGGPMAKELREHAMRVGSIPDEAITNVSADTSSAKASLSGLAAFAKAHGAAVAAAFAAGIVDGFRNSEGVVTASADRVAGAIDRAARARLQIKSPSKVGESIGGEFVTGISLGIERDSELAAQQSAALAGGFEEIWRQAATLTAEESLRIWSAMDKVREAQAALTWIRADGRATAEQLYRAELALAQAQREVNDAVFEGRDASEELTTALEEQSRAAQRLNDSLDGALGALDALNGVRGARSSLSRAENDLREARARQGALPAEIAEAERELARVRREGVNVTAAEALGITRARLAVTRAEAEWAEAQADTTLTVDERTAAEQELAVARENLTRAQEQSTAVTGNVEAAERRLADLRKEQTEIVNRVAEASQRLQSAQLAVVDAQRQLIAAGQELTGSEAGMVAFFEQIARQAGLSRSAIEALVGSIREAVDAAETGYAPRTPGSTTPAPALRPIVRDANNDGKVTLAEQQAYGRAVRERNIAERAASKKSTTVNVYPKTAVYDAKQTAATLQIMELLRR